MKRINSIITVAVISVLFTLTVANFSYIIDNNQNLLYDYNLTSDKDLLQVSEISEKIHINNNWTEAITEGICTGNGTFSEPYIIEDLIIDGYSSSYCILIENSDSFVKIENCTLFNSNFGMRLSYTKNVQILNNNCSSHLFGISLYYSSNNTIFSNNAFDNTFDGISLLNSDKNNISGNIEYDNSNYGISIFDSDNNVILNNTINSGIQLGGIYNNLSGNLMTECGLEISHSNTDNFYFQYIDTSNLVNERSLYYYTNKKYLGPNNFTDAGQIIMASCSNSLVTNVNLSYSETGLTLINCNDNIITKNSVNSNRKYGIYIFGGENNTISNNTVSYNMLDGILLEYNINNFCLENNVSYNNYDGIYCYRLENSIISRNNINNNKRYGIRFFYCISNTIIENTLIGNEECFYIDSLSEENTFQDNNCRSRAPSILGYNIFIILGILSIYSIILYKKIKKQDIA